MPNPPYPLEIIPRDLYPLRLSWEEILRVNGSFLVCRRLDQPLDKCVYNLAGGIRVLKLDALGKHVVKMSMNLLGGKFDESHILFNPKKMGSKEWKGNAVSDIAANEEFYDYLTQGSSIYYSSDDIHRRTYPVSLYFSPKEGKTYKALRDNVKSLCLDAFKGMETTVEMPVTLFVAHVPTNLNYWHVQLEMKPAPEDDEKCFKNDSSYRKDIYTQIITDVLCKKFKEAIDDYSAIPCCAYCRLLKKCQYLR